MTTPGEITLRPLALADCDRIPAAFAAQGWDKPAALYRHYLAEQAAGQRAVLVADLFDEFAGYATIVWESGYPPFRAAAIPEIMDLNVLIKFRRRGLATALLDEAERLIAQHSPIAGLGVGLYADYGPAQILYARRGYVPDGRGLWRAGRQVLGGEPREDECHSDGRRDLRQPLLAVAPGQERC